MNCQLRDFTYAIVSERGNRVKNGTERKVVGMMNRRDFSIVTSREREHKHQIALTFAGKPELSAMKLIRSVRACDEARDVCMMWQQGILNY